MIDYRRAQRRGRAAERVWVAIFSLVLALLIAWVAVDFTEQLTHRASEVMSVYTR